MVKKASDTVAVAFRVNSKQYAAFERIALEMGAIDKGGKINQSAAAASLVLYAMNQKGVGNILYDLRERIKMEVYREISDKAHKHLSAFYKEIQDDLKTR